MTIAIMLVITLSINTVIAIIFKMQVTVTAVFLVCHSIRAIVSLAELLVTLLGETIHGIT